MKSWNLIATSLIILIIIAYLIYPKIVPLLKKNQSKLEKLMSKHEFFLFNTSGQ